MSLCCAFQEQTTHINMLNEFTQTKFVEFVNRENRGLSVVRIASERIE